MSAPSPDPVRVPRMPERVPVSVDLGAGELVVAGATARLMRDPTADEVLAAYLSLVYSLRRARPGSPIVLREFDVAVLARGLDLARADVDRRLHALMGEPADDSGLATRVHLRRLALVTGVVIALVGIVLGLRARRSDEPVPIAPTESSPSLTSMVVPPAELIPPANVTSDEAGAPAG